MRAANLAPQLNTIFFILQQETLVEKMRKEGEFFM